MARLTVESKCRCLLPESSVRCHDRHGHDGDGDDVHLVRMGCRSVWTVMMASLRCVPGRVWRSLPLRADPRVAVAAARSA